MSQPDTNTIRANYPLPEDVEAFPREACQDILDLCDALDAANAEFKRLHRLAELRHGRAEGQMERADKAERELAEANAEIKRANIAATNQAAVVRAYKAHHDALHGYCDDYGPGGPGSWKQRAEKAEALADEYRAALDDSHAVLLWLAARFGTASPADQAAARRLAVKASDAWRALKAKHPKENTDAGAVGAGGERSRSKGPTSQTGTSSAAQSRLRIGDRGCANCGWPTRTEEGYCYDCGEEWSVDGERWGVEDALGEDQND